MLRQGDVLLIPTQLPTKAKLVKKGTTGLIEIENDKVILARGEMTGHHHSLKRKGVNVYKAEDKRYITVAAETTVDHQEHDPIVLVEGCYEVRHQRQYDKEITLRANMD